MSKKGSFDIEPDMTKDAKFLLNNLQKRTFSRYIHTGSVCRYFYEILPTGTSLGYVLNHQIQNSKLLCGMYSQL